MADVDVVVPAPADDFGCRVKILRLTGGALLARLEAFEGLLDCAPPSVESSDFTLTVNKQTNSFVNYPDNTLPTYNIKF